MKNKVILVFLILAIGASNFLFVSLLHQSKGIQTLLEKPSVYELSQGLPVLKKISDNLSRWPEQRLQEKN